MASDDSSSEREKQRERERETKRKKGGDGREKEETQGRREVYPVSTLPLSPIRRPVRLKFIRRLNV